jgi:uncharacterized membrane protein
LNAARIARISVLAGYLGLVALLLLRYAWLLPNPVLLALMLVPLLFPLRGLLAGRAYTHAWTSFLALGYFALGVWHAAAAAERTHGLLMVLASAVLFGGCLAWVRVSAATARD